MRRLGRLLLGASAVLLYLGAAGVGENRNSLPLTVVGLLVAAGCWALWGFVQRRRPIVASGWTPTAAVSFEPARSRPGASRSSVSLALARVEARELTTSTAFGVGLGFCGLVLFLFGRVWVGDWEGDLPSTIELSPILTHPLAGMVVLASFRARTRARRDAVEELFEACPTSQSTRTVGHLLTGWASMLCGLVFVALMTALVAIGGPTIFGEVGVRQVAALVGAGLLCLGATCLGVALARWAPWTLVPVAAVTAIGFAAVHLATQGTRTTEPVRQLSTFLVDPEIDVRLTAPHWLAHHLWILALVAIVAVLAVLRDHRGRRVIAAGAVAVALAVTAGVAATRPIDATDARRIATLVGDPAAQPCVDAGGLAVCTYEGDDELATVLADTVRPVGEAAAPGALDGWSVRQGESTEWHNLDPEVRALLGEPPAVDDHVIPISFNGHPLALQGLRLWSGLAATGVLDRWVHDMTLGIRGEARGVIALWLATRGADEDVQQDLTSVGLPYRDGRDAARPWPDTCFAGPVPVLWAETDVAAARQLLAVPEADVRAVLLADWDRWTRRETTTDDLLVALGLDPVGLEGHTPSGSEC